MVSETSFGPIRLIPAPGKGRYPNCHSVYIEDAGVLIDPGSDRERLQLMRDRGEIRTIWLTHWHEDHQTHLDLFPELPLWIGEHDAPPLGDLEVMLDWYGMADPSERDFYRDFLQEKFHIRPRTIDRMLKDGDVIDLGCVTVEVIHAPGHTPGHLALYFREPQVLFLGDMDLTPFGPWYGDRDSNIDQIIETVERLRKIPAKAWLTSHEKGVYKENPGELWDAYLQVIERREAQLLELLKSSPTMEQIVNAWIVYGKEREPREFYEFGERSNIEKHLNRLVNAGTVVFEGRTYSLSKGT